jgi:hypothetical protein
MLARRPARRCGLHRHTDPRLSPLAVILLLLLMSVAGLLWWLSQPHKSPQVIVALAKHNMAAFSIIRQSDIKLAIRSADRADAWHSVAGSALLLQPMRAGDIVSPKETLVLSGITIPHNAMVIGVGIVNDVVGEFQPGQRVEILGDARRPVHVAATFLGLQRDGHEAVLAISGANSLRFGPILSSIRVILVRPLWPSWR